MKKLFLTAGLIAATIVSSPAIDAKTPPVKPKTLVFASNNCLITGDQPPAGAQALLGAIIAIIAPILVELAVDSLIEDLRKIKSVSSSGSMDFDLWQRQGEESELTMTLPRCVTAVTAESDRVNGLFLETIVATRSINPGATEAQIIARLADNDIAVKRLYHLFEARLEPSEDSTAFRLNPQFVRTFALMPGNSAKKQGLAFNVSLRGPGASPWGTTYAMAPVSVGEASAGDELHLRSTDTKSLRKLAALKTGLMVAPGMSDAAYQVYLRDYRERKVDAFMPVNLHVEVVQTQKPSDADLFLAKVLEKAKPKITEKVAAAVNPDGAFTASQAKLDAQIAMLKADKALADAQAAANPDAKAIEILKLEAQKAKDKFDKLP